MGGVPLRVCRIALAGAGLSAMAAVFFSVWLFSIGALASPIISMANQTPNTMIRPARGDCAPSCPECTDCIPEIEIAPRPYRERDDPIGHAIKRLEPSPLLAPDACPETEVERLRKNPSVCGIRCWYWRLRYGYCGPGCEYYRYRLNRQVGFPDYHRRHSPPPPQDSCRS
jgi:hypothetical protein